MLRRIISCLVAGLSLCVPAAGLAAPGIEVLVDRRADQVSVYFALPAEDLNTFFGQGAEALLDADGTVDIEGLYDGTYLVADDIFAGATIRIDGKPVLVEALSMMLHDPEFLPTFTDPYDAQVSIAVCTSPETVRGMSLPELRAYLGYYVWDVDGRAPLEITFPALGRDAVEVTFRDFVDFREVGSTTVTLADGGVLTLEAADEGRGGAFPWTLGAVVSAALALAVALGLGVWFATFGARSERERPS